MSGFLFCSILGEYFQRATHYTAGIEQRIGDGTRVRFSAFDRQSENFDAFQYSSGCPPPTFPGTTSLNKGYSRGLQLVLQRRSANRLSGWIGYTLVFAKQNSYPNIGTFPATQYLPSLEDQRNSLNAFASYRLTPSINLSGKLLYGSGYPVSVFPNVPRQPPLVQRLPAYARVDFRVDKSWAFTRWKTTLYGEVLNLTNHNNVIATGFQSGIPQVAIKTERALPVVPTAGLVFEF